MVTWTWFRVNFARNGHISRPIIWPVLCLDQDNYDVQTHNHTWISFWPHREKVRDDVNEIGICFESTSHELITYHDKNEE